MYTLYYALYYNYNRCKKKKLHTCKTIYGFYKSLDPCVSMRIQSEIIINYNAHIATRPDVERPRLPLFNIHAQQRSRIIYVSSIIVVAV